MSKKRRGITRKVGLPPGTLVHVGRENSADVGISVIDYTSKDFQEIECSSPEALKQYVESHTNSWINIDGVHNTQLLAATGRIFDLHILLLEDVANAYHRPKIEDFENCIFLSLKMLGVSPTGDDIVSEQVSLVLGKHWVISFQEQPGDLFNNIRERLRDSSTQMRIRGCDYLFYRLVDTIVDNYFLVLEHLSDQLEALEESVIESPTTNRMVEIQQMKKRISSLRRSIAPLREAVTAIEHLESPLVAKSTMRFWRDVYEHIVHATESIEIQRDYVSSIMDLYMNGVSNQMNKVMQVLTIIATIFIPLTFIAGIYGMNFEYMPELGFKYSYFILWGVMVIIALFLLRFFRVRKWI
jgi:magnesium transporter